MLSTEIWNKRKFRIESYDPSSTVDLDIWSRRQSDRAKKIILPVTPPIRIYSIKNLARASACTKSSTGLPGPVTLMLIVIQPRALRALGLLLADGAPTVHNDTAVN